MHYGIKLTRAMSLFVLLGLSLCKIGVAQLAPLNGGTTICSDGKKYMCCINLAWNVQPTNSGVWGVYNQNIQQINQQINYSQWVPYNQQGCLVVNAGVAINTAATGPESASCNQKTKIFNTTTTCQQA